MFDAHANPAAAARLGICSWSLRPKAAPDLAAGIAKFGIPRVQLALNPIAENRPGWGEIETLHALDGVALASGMMATKGEDYSTLESIARTGGVRPDATWGANLGAAHAIARLARRLGLHLITFHAGFIPHHPGPARDSMIRRLRHLADIFDDHGLRVGLETGQETADTLLHALSEIDRPQLGVNFDPANMILYNMGDPVAALQTLAPRIVQVHIKDASPTATPGTWGAEKPAGEGSVDWSAFFDTLKARAISVPLIVECEAGDTRIQHAIQARDLASAHLQRIGGAA
ncbi:MAG TPA: sugar phosphate isomerase/epimerase family protein [Phycisphaerales bacterium]|nr:sugar phosphate isomerase/epimerase family protein [Phycisphaerales bacterium]